MQDKETLILRLETLLSELKESSSEIGMRRALRNAQLPYFYWDEELDYRLRRIERHLHEIAERPTQSCRMGADDGEEIIQLMTGRGAAERGKGVKYLADWMEQPHELTIADPYLIKNSGAISETDYKNSIQGLLPLTLKRLELFVGPRNSKYQKTGVAAWFNSLCAARGIELSVYHQEEVHDRVWISGGNKALVVGTSFNGLGNKCAFLLKLDDADTANFNAELRRIRGAYACLAEV